MFPGLSARGCSFIFIALSLWGNFMAVKAAKADSFEKNLERLEAIVNQMENADLPLEKALELYEEGMKLSALCQQQLEAAEGRVEILKKRAGGEMVAEPFVPGDPEPE